MVSSISEIKNFNSKITDNERITLSQYDFLNLLITQLQNQNPLNPLDYHEMTSQLIQFGNLETLNKISQGFENLIAYQASINSLQATQLIGKKVKFAGSLISVDKGEVSEGYYQLSRPGNVKVYIMDTMGNLIRRLDEGFKTTSEQRLVWDGKDNIGNSVSDGIYLFKISATDENGKPIDIKSFQLSKIKGISFENGIVYIDHLLGRSTMEDIISIMD
ncbi:MAG: flagellar hook assembly protein FlgD [Candidatus Jordarchaeum sp.]|uniref:flagellar hook assembly protein FlgD n=1 Tax=Candidatus Jordarchaeum sp. TaxID=2823881 RepID=UPI00404ADD81